VVRNVIATLGTALTPEHVAELSHFCDKVILVYDADEPGIKAAERAVSVFLTARLDVSIAIPPDELDPADLLARPGGGAAWNRVLDGACDALQYQLSRFQDQVKAAETVTARENLAEEFLRGLSAQGLEHSSIMRRNTVLSRVAEFLRLPEQSVRDMAKRLVPQRRPVAGATRADGPAVVAEPVSRKIKALHTAEEQLIGCLLRQPELFQTPLADGRTLDEAVTPADFIRPEAARLYSLITTRLMDKQEVTLATLLADLAQDNEMELGRLATQAEDMAGSQASPEDPQPLKSMAWDAANALLTHQRAAEYSEPRAAVAVQAAGEDEMKSMRHVQEQLRAHLPGKWQPGLSVEERLKADTAQIHLSRRRIGRPKA
jgi:DNA primase